MGSKNVIPAISNVLLVLMLVGFAKSDFQQDRAECADQLVGLATCLPYVGGDAKAPSLDCCGGLKQVLGKSEKCLCVLIKDRNDPNLGLKINATLAASLPSACHAPVNVSDCINLLHLPAGSPDAKAFEGYANMTKGSVSTPAATGNSTSSKSSSSAEKSDGDQRAANGWHDIVVTKIMCGLIIWAFASFGI